MTNYKMLLQYEGTRYNGWQKQGNTENTIQEKLEKVLSEMAGSPITLIGSGRTDAGAHAIGQVANFHVDSPLNASEILAYLNKYLPKDIGVLSIEIAEERFHARHHALSKLYVYRCRTSMIPDVFERQTCFHYGKALSLESMRQGATYLLGEHDFKAFCSNKRYKKSTIRNIFNIEIKEQHGVVKFYFRGDGFLYNMVRILVGTLMDVGEGKLSADAIPAILSGLDREAAGITVPACGLTLLEVVYEASPDIIE